MLARSGTRGDPRIVARLILIRHGESVANAARRFTHGPEEPLSRKGREEALERARHLRDVCDPVALYASPFVRALETARLIGRVFGLEPAVVEDLREQSYGELHGQSYEAARVGFARESGPLDLWRLRPPGGESLEEVARRVGPAVEAIATRHVGEQVIVVSHGGVMASLRAYVAGAFEGFPVISGNAGGYVLERVRTVWVGPQELDDLEG